MKKNQVVQGVKLKGADKVARIPIKVVPSKSVQRKPSWIRAKAPTGDRVKQLKQRLADTGGAAQSLQGITDKSELRALAHKATARLAMGRDGAPLNLLPGSGDPSAGMGRRRLVVEADFVTCTQ